MDPSDLYVTIFLPELGDLFVSHQTNLAGLNIKVLPDCLIFNRSALHELEALLISLPFFVFKKVEFLAGILLLAFIPIIVERDEELVVVFIEVNEVSILRYLLKLLCHPHFAHKLLVVGRVILLISRWSIVAHDFIKGDYIRTILHFAIGVDHLFALLHHHLLLHFTLSALLNGHGFLQHSVFLDAIHEGIKWVLFEFNRRLTVRGLQQALLERIPVRLAKLWCTKRISPRRQKHISFLFEGKQRKRTFCGGFVKQREIKLNLPLGLDSSAKPVVVPWGRCASTAAALVPLPML